VSSKYPLAGRGVVITRPAGESQRLAALIRDAGGVPLYYPAIEICDALDPRPLDDAIARLDAFDLAIFISPSAVEKAMTRITARRALPAKLRCAAIGPGGVRALERFGVSDVIAPLAHGRRYDSESLLASAFMQNVEGLRIVIFRGDGGRELLSETLTARQATVESVTCYRRAQPALDSAPLLQAWARGEVAAVIITSSEGLRNLCDMLGAAGLAHLRNSPIVVPHPRIAATAREMGMQQVLESASGDEALVQTVIHHVSS
jgi:uroporphyrinogen-III synthase